MRLGSWAISAGAALAALAVFGGDQSTAPSRPERIHPDPAGVENGMVAALRAFLVGDGKAARAALDGVEENCRRLGPDEQPGYPAKIVTWDVAFHRDLDVVRELTLRGEMEKAYDRFTFLPRGCTGCHAAAAKESVPGVPGARR